MTCLKYSLHTLLVVQSMSEDYTVKGIERAVARLKQQKANVVNIPAKQQQTNTVTNKPVAVEPSPALAASPAFDLEAFRLDIIRKAIAKIMINKQKEMNK